MLETCYISVVLWYTFPLSLHCLMKVIICQTIHQEIRAETNVWEICLVYWHVICHLLAWNSYFIEIWGRLSLGSGYSRHFNLEVITMSYIQQHSPIYQIWYCLLNKCRGGGGIVVHCFHFCAQHLVSIFCHAIPCWHIHQVSGVLFKEASLCRFFVREFPVCLQLELPSVCQ